MRLFKFDRHLACAVVLKCDMQARECWQCILTGVWCGKKNNLAHAAGTIDHALYNPWGRGQTAARA